MSNDTNKELLSVEPLPTYEVTIGCWLWMLEDTRRDTKKALVEVEQAVLDWTPSPEENSIGTLLYHIGLIELDWLYVEVLENAPWPQELKELFPLPARDERRGMLTAVRDVSLAEHLQRLDTMRKYLLAAFREMTLEEFRRPRHFLDYDVTPEWVLHHLVQHEVEHRGQIQILRSLAERSLKVV